METLLFVVLPAVPAFWLLVKGDDLWQERKDWPAIKRGLAALSLFPGVGFGYVAARVLVG